MLEMADIFRQYGQAYCEQFKDRILPSHLRAINDILQCRTQALGGQLYVCPDCRKTEYKYHSCMNRHCPKCQNDQAQQWLQKQCERLLPVPYFLVTFTLPQELRKFALSNQKLVYDLMFKASAQAMIKLALDPKYIGGSIGFLGVLHTWARDLTFHPHIHYLVPAGGISTDNKTWLPAKSDFFLPVKALSKIFRAKLRDEWRKTDLLQQVPAQVWRKKWVVHCKPAATGQEVLTYFAPYVFRVALSNKRLVKLENDHVTFRYKDAKTQQWRTCTLPVFQFIARFLMHVLPRGFKKVRAFGFLSAKQKRLFLLLRYILGTVAAEPTEVHTKQPPCYPCPQCGQVMLLMATLLPQRRAPPICIGGRIKSPWSSTSHLGQGNLTP
jgi:hypothetical protein